MSRAFIYQIHHAGAEAGDVGFLRLDNSANERPDWYEYWPIRQFLARERLDETAYYGFLSPKFRLKTNLSAAAVHAYVAQQDGAADVVLFSPSLQLTAYHWNVFQFGESMHPGLCAVAEAFFRAIGKPTDLGLLCTDSRIEVYSNFFIARPRFWRAWLAVTEALFEAAERGSDALAVALRTPTRYRGERQVQMKIFLMERIATWLLAYEAGFSVRVRDPFAARSRLYKLPGAILCDALKIAHATSGEPAYRTLFGRVSRFGKILSWQIRLANALGLGAVRRCLKSLGRYWTDAGAA